MRYLPSATVILISTLLVRCSTAPLEVERAPDASTTQATTRIALRADNGRFVCVELGEGDASEQQLVANRDGIGEWETFLRVPMGLGRIALKAHNGRFVCADQGRAGLLCADREQPGEWETFEEVSLADGRVALRTLDGKFVCAEINEDGGGRLIADRDYVGAWESFTVITDLPAPSNN